MARSPNKPQFEALILASLREEARHGYAIARAIEVESKNTLEMREGALYPALRSLEQRGLVKSEWQQKERGPSRRVYQLTRAGKAALRENIASWRQYVKAVNAILGSTS